MAYCLSAHESTGETTAKSMFGRECDLPIDLLVGRLPGKPIKDVPDYVKTLQA